MAWMKGIKCPSSHLQRASHAAPHLTAGPATWCVLLGLSWALSLLAVVVVLAAILAIRLNHLS
jgi:hypothetical protein